MRAIFGLVGLLVTIGVLAVFMSEYLKNTQVQLNAVDRVKPEINHITGHGADGLPAQQSATLTEGTTNNRFTSLHVAAVTAGGAYDTYYGLKSGDSIIAIDGARIGDFELADPEMAKAQIVGAYRRQAPITVIRNGVTLNLPAVSPSGTPASSPLLKSLSGNP